MIHISFCRKCAYTRFTFTCCETLTQRIYGFLQLYLENRMIRNEQPHGCQIYDTQLYSKLYLESVTVYRTSYSLPCYVINLVSILSITKSAMKDGMVSVGFILKNLYTFPSTCLIFTGISNWVKLTHLILFHCHGQNNTTKTYMIG